MLNTSRYTSRYFNIIKEDEYTVTKSSTHIVKINNEYKYYYYLPKTIQKYFVKPYNLFIDNNIASYTMEKIKTKNLGELLIFKEIDFISFHTALNKIKLFKKECISVGGILKCSNYDSEYLVIQKTEERIMNRPELFPLLERIKSAYSLYINERSSWNKIISHGDLCLSNILWNNELKQLLLIDPRGADILNDIYMDEYYDLAKLSHSIFGGYENIIYNSNNDNPISKEVKDIFYDFLIEQNISINLLRLYEASLFLSMIPLHIDNPKNMKLFEDNCDKILKEIGF